MINWNRVGVMTVNNPDVHSIYRWMNVSTCIVCSHSWLTVKFHKQHREFVWILFNKTINESGMKIKFRFEWSCCLTVLPLWIWALSAQGRQHQGSASQHPHLHPPSKAPLNKPLNLTKDSWVLVLLKKTLRAAFCSDSSFKCYHGFTGRVRMTCNSLSIY